MSKILRRILQMRKIRKPVICIIVLALSILLSGCMKMHIDIIWNEDNSAVLAVTVGVDPSALSEFDFTEDEIREMLKESLEDEMDEDDDYTIEDFSDDDYVGVIVTTKLDDITKNTDDSIEHLKFTFETVSGTKTYTVQGDFMDSDILGDEADEIDVDVRITIVMPGKLVSHNATESRGNKLTWIQEDPNVAVSIYARSEVGGFPWLWIVIGAVVLIAGGAVAVLLVLKKKKASPQAGQYGSSPTAYGAPPQSYAPPGQQPYSPQYQQPPPPPPAYEPPAPPPPSAYEPPTPPPPPAYEPPAPPQPPAYEPPAPPPAPAALMFCTQCGAQLPEGTKFCPSCGTPIA